MQPPKAADASDAGERPQGAPESSASPGAAAGPSRADGPTASTTGHLAGSTLASADAALTDRVSGDEPLLPARVHRPSDLMRLLIGIAAIGVLFAIAAFAQGTTTGLEDDISKGTEQAPDLLIKIAGLVSSIAVLLVPVAFAIERLIKRDGLRIADGVLAAVLAHGVTLATDLWVSRTAPGTIQDALTQPQTSGGLTDPVHGYLAPVIAYMTAVGMARRPRWRVVLWVVLLLDAFAMLVGGYTTPFSIVLTVLIGWTVAYGTLYAVGSPNVRRGMLLLTGLFVLCLDASIRAFSGPDVPQLSYASIAVVFLAGNALGSAAPTPGGMGAVEGALTLGLIAVGLPKEVAAPAVLLYRVMTLWLPVLPGWLAFNQLTRKGEL
ncbi:hypothetical protein SBADM41S_11417 [Streptomyces badius]